MSYILDALRRSQAERERGQVPGLDARPAAVAALAAGPSGQRWRRGAAVAAAALALAFALLWGWRMLRPTAPEAVTVHGPKPEPAAVPAVVPSPLPRLDKLPVPAPPPMPVVVSAPPAAPSVTVTTVVPPVPAAVLAPASRAAAAAPAATPWAALTPAQRRELPPLVMGGSIWSDNALSRFVIVNGQVVREGETAAPGVVVERIEPKAVLMRWRELRLEVPL